MHSLNVAISNIWVKTRESSCIHLMISVLLISIGTAGCMTYELRKMAKNDRSYSEEVTSVLMSEDGENIVFIGDDYHYIFDAPLELINSLSSSFRKSLFAKFKDFRVDIQSQVIGTVTIYLDESASQEDKNEAIKIGYEKRPDGPALELTIFGKRYNSGDVTIDNEGYRLNYTYQVKVLEERGSLEKAALTAATPITVLADGALWLVGVPLVILLQISPN